MKKIILCISSLLCLSTAYASQTTITSTIKSVTVYQRQAKINRTATVSLSAGVNEIVLENLTRGLMQNSIQVKIQGDATLLSASYQTNYLKDTKKDARIAELNDSLKLLSKKIAQINNQTEVYTGEEKVIEQNQKLGSENESVSVTQIRELADFYRNRLLEIKNALLDLSLNKEQFVKKRQRVEQQLNELNSRQSKPTGEIVLSVVSNRQTNVAIDFSYVVHSAGWSPIYDIRSDSPDQPAELVYKANVYQNTGFDWNDVILTVSTGNPSADNSRPIMHPFYIDFVQQTKYRYISANSKLSASEPVQMNQAIIKEEDLSEHIVPPEYTVTETGNQINAEYKIEIPQDIPSDNKQHLVRIQKFELKADFAYHTVPKLSDGAFLLAKVSDYGKYNLLPGNANIFSEGMYIGQSYINPRTTADTLLLSLGRDDKIMIKRILLSDLTSKKTIGSNIKEIKAYEIMIRNNKNTSVSIEVLDQIPLSKNKDIEVSLEEQGGAKYIEDYGRLSWELAIPPGKTKRLRFIFSVKYPKNKRVSGI